MNVLREIRKDIGGWLHTLRSRNHELSRLQIGNGSVVATPRRVEGATGITMGESSFIGEGAWLATYPDHAAPGLTPRLQIGHGVNIGAFACITCIGSIIIEDHCLFSEYVYVSDHTHGYDPEAGPVIQQPLSSKGGVRIGANCFVGYRVSILSGVELGRNCVVGAHAVVTRSFPEFSMLGGVPAVLLKRYHPEEGRWIPVVNQ